MSKWDRAVAHVFIENSWRNVVGKTDRRVMERWKLEDAMITEWSPEFEKAMRNRLLIGAYRYGPMRKSGEEDGANAKEAIRRIGRYLKTGKLEGLVDAANFCLVEFDRARVDGVTLHSVDDGEHMEKGRSR